MSESTPPPLPEDDLHALADGQFPPARAAASRERLDADDRARLAQWEAQRHQLRALHAHLADEPLPGPLRAAAEQVQAAHDRQTALWRLGGLAASVVLAFSLGWASHGYRQDGQALASAPATRLQHFAQQASVAHAVYQPEQRHPVEVAATQQEHLVQWLSKRLGRPLTLPVLTPQGFELVGGRLLPGENGARAQFMYQNPAGQRITLYLGALDGAGAAETAFRLHTDGPVPAFYWLDQGFGYALSGPLSREALLALATAVHQQL